MTSRLQGLKQEHGLKVKFKDKAKHSNFVISASGGASTAKEPGHFEVRTFSSQVIRMHFFLNKVHDLIFSRRPQNIKAANAAEIV